MDEKIIDQIKSNLNEIKTYAERFPENSGWRWAIESIDKTLKLFEPQEEASSDDDFDMPKEVKVKSITNDADAAGGIKIKDTRVDLTQAHPVDEAGNIILPTEEEE